MQDTVDKDMCYIVVSGRVMVIREILNSDNNTIIEVRDPLRRHPTSCQYTAAHSPSLAV